MREKASNFFKKAGPLAAPLLPRTKIEQKKKSEEKPEGCLV